MTVRAKDLKVGDKIRIIYGSGGTSEIYEVTEAPAVALRSTSGAVISYRVGVKEELYKPGSKSRPISIGSRVEIELLERGDTTPKDPRERTDLWGIPRDRAAEEKAAIEAEVRRGKK